MISSIINDTLIQIEINLKKVELTFFKFTWTQSVLIFSNFAHPCPFFGLSVFLLSSSTVLSRYCDISDPNGQCRNCLKLCDIAPLSGTIHPVWLKEIHIVCTCNVPHIYLSSFFLGGITPSPNTENTGFACGGGNWGNAADPGCSAGWELTAAGPWWWLLTAEVVFALKDKQDSVTPLEHGKWQMILLLFFIHFFFLLMLPDLLNEQSSLLFIYEA